MSARRRRRRLRQTGWNLLDIAIFVVMVFPVFWMISTAFKSNEEIVSLNPTWFPFPPTLQHFRDAERFWRICDANRATWPDDLLEEAAILRIPASEG